jgi:hypothetical protein
VEIRTDPPGASVRVGDHSCLSPNCRFKLKPGQYQIAAQLKGYQPAERNLTIDPSTAAEPITLVLQPLPSPPLSAGSKSTPTGTLVVQSGQPDALVSIDRVPSGRTDGQGVFRVQLEAKSHQIQLEKNGYRTPPEQQVDIAKGASRELTFVLDPLRSESKSESKAKAKLEDQQSRQAEDKKNAAKAEPYQMLADLQTAARQDISRGDFASARQKAQQIEVAGGSSSELLTDLDQAQAQALKVTQYENSYQQAVQQYRQAAANNDKSALEAARNSFQSIAQQGGSHAPEAQKYSRDIDKRLVALNQPPPNTAPQPAPPAPPPASLNNPDKPLQNSVDESTAVRDVIGKYAQAFDDKNADALRQLWPSMGEKYAEYKKSFDNAKAQHLEVTIQTVQISDDGQQATVATSVMTNYTPKGSKMMKRSDQAQFDLVKQNGTWVIRNVR